MKLERASHWAGVIGTVVAVFTLLAGIMGSANSEKGASARLPIVSPPTNVLQASGPTIGCKDPSTWHARALCAGDEQLVMLDRELEITFRRGLLSRRGEAKRHFLNEQRTWLGTLPKLCERMTNDIHCLKLAYQDRLKRLGME